MTGAEVLALVASHGVRVTFFRGDLQLDADREPSAEALAALRDHKAAVVAELRRNAMAATEQHRFFERHVATIIRIRGLPRPDAEHIAFENFVTEHLNASHLNTSSDRCHYCGKPELPAAILKPIGWGARHTWLHDGCWAPWREARRSAVISELPAEGIVGPRPDRPGYFDELVGANETGMPDWPEAWLPSERQHQTEGIKRAQVKERARQKVFAERWR